MRLEGRRRLCRLKQFAAADAHLSTAWQQNAMRIADFLSKADPNWSKNTPRRSNKTPPVDDERGRRAVEQGLGSGRSCVRPGVSTHPPHGRRPVGWNRQTSSEQVLLTGDTISMRVPCALRRVPASPRPRVSTAPGTEGTRRARTADLRPARAAVPAAGRSAVRRQQSTSGPVRSRAAADRFRSPQADHRARGPREPHRPEESGCS